METKKYTLPKEFAEKWVEALRSGEYEKCTEKLTDGSAFCCLGVACYINGYSINEISSDTTIPLYMYKIPRILRGHADGSNLIGKLTMRNDKKTYTFKGIARWLEQNVNFV